MNISISKIAIAGLAAVGATTFAIFAASGSSSTSARRFLLRSSIKTVVYATKVYSSHRLKNTQVDCARINQILTDSEACIYGPGNENTGCILGVTIANDVIEGASDTAITFLGDSTILDSDPDAVVIPESQANTYVADVNTICTKARAGTILNMDELALAEVSNEPLTQEELTFLIDQYIETNVLPTCEENAPDPADCALLQDAIDAVMAAGNLGGFKGADAIALA